MGLWVMALVVSTVEVTGWSGEKNGVDSAPQSSMLPAVDLVLAMCTPYVPHPHLQPHKY